MVWRVETAEGKGPFSCWSLVPLSLIGQFPGAGFPAIGDDVDAFEYGRHICGCDDRSIIDEWFGDALETLRELGFMVKWFKLPAETVQKGRSGKQVAFDRAQAIEMGVEA